MKYCRLSGFTLIEVIVAIAISTVAFLALAELIPYFYTANASIAAQWQSVEVDRVGIENAALVLRSASAVTDAEDSTITFDAMVNGTTTPISYTLQDSTLESENLDTSDTETIASYLTNGDSMPIFTYYDASGTELTDPVDPTQVASVGMSITVNANPSAGSVGTTLLSGAALRNLPSP